jgi:hypothetical protein
MPSTSLLSQIRVADSSIHLKESKVSMKSVNIEVFYSVCLVNTPLRQFVLDHTPTAQNQAGRMLIYGGLSYCKLFKAALNAKIEKAQGLGLVTITVRLVLIRKAWRSCREKRPRIQYGSNSIVA